MSQNESVAKEQTLTEHLEELRRRLVYSLLIVFLGVCVAWAFHDKIFDFIRLPIQPYLKQGGLIYTGVMDKFVAHLKVSALAGVLLTCPLWLYQVWLFIAPGLYRNERRYVIGFIFSGTFLFLLGSAFAFYLVYPMAFSFLFKFGGETDIAMISIDGYLSFFSMTTLAFGAAFELPLVLTLFTMAGIIDQAFLKKYRRYAIVLLAIACAVITPPDALSMGMMLVPMVILYEVSVILAGVFERKRQRSEVEAPSS